MGLKLDEKDAPVGAINVDKVPKPIVNSEFLEVLHNTGIEASTDPTDR